MPEAIVVIKRCPSIKYEKTFYKSPEEIKKEQLFEEKRERERKAQLERDRLERQAQQQKLEEQRKIQKEFEDIASQERTRNLKIFVLMVAGLLSLLILFIVEPVALFFPLFFLVLPMGAMWIIYWIICKILEAIFDK